MRQSIGRTDARHIRLSAYAVDASLSRRELGIIRDVSRRNMPGRRNPTENRIQLS
jgi:hypothetical protein